MAMMNASNNHGRRCAQRWAPDRPLNAQIVAGDIDIPCRIINVSNHGLCVETGENFPLGSYLSLQADFADNAGIDLDAKLIWRGQKTPSTPAVLGLLLTKRKDWAAYQQALDTCPKQIWREQERRRGSRRAEQTEQKKETSSNRRRFERRGAVSISQRLVDRGQELDDWISRHQYQRILQSASDAWVTTGGARKIMLGGNNYLGLTQHPSVREAAIEAIMSYGVGAGSVRMLGGSMDLHQQLEERLAAFKGAEACVLLPSGYAANFAVLGAILERGDIVLNDILNHASIVDGCRATPATIRFYRHNSLSDLANKLQKYEYDRNKLIITDGVFSMDGDVAPLKDILELAKANNAMLMVDDAHATGVIGPTGRGTAEYCGILGQPDITVCTLSKGLGAIGGAICGSRSLIKTILHRSRPFIFTSALPPAVCASALAAIDVIESEPALLTNLHNNRAHLYAGLKSLGYTVWDTPSAIMPVIIGDEDKTYALAALLNELGVFVNAVTQPAVAHDLCRLRVSVMATHTLSDLDQALNAFEQAGKKLKII